MAENLQMQAAPNAVEAVPPANLLTSFHAVAEQQSMAQAAAVLCLPYSIVSQQMTRLERVIGTKLMERRGIKLALTGTGQTLYEQINAQVLELQEQAQGALTLRPQPAAPAKPTINVQLSLWGLAASLKPYLPALADLPYGVNFQSTPQAGQNPDLICYLAKSPQKGYRNQLLFGEEVISVVAADYPIAEDGIPPEGLLDHPLLRLAHPDHEEDWAAYLGLDPSAPLPGISKDPYSSFSHYMRALHAGRGVGVGLAPFFARELSAGTLRLASPRRLWRNRACFLGVNEEGQNKKIAMEFAEHLKEIFAPASSE